MKDFDSSWFEELKRVDFPSGRQKDGLVISRQMKPAHYVHLDKPLHVEHMQSLYRHWFEDILHWNKTADGLEHYKGPTYI